MKKEEEKSYVLMYVICAAILILVQVWAVWNEVVGKRKWKEYQSKFYALMVDNAKKDLEEAKKRFESPDVQEKYQVINDKLKKAENEFRMSGNQNEFNKLEDAMRAVRSKELVPLQLQLSDIRNQVMEAEYLYTKYQTEEYRLKKEKLENESKKLFAIVEKVNARMSEMQEKKVALTSETEKYRNEIIPFTAPVNKLQEKLTLLTRKRPSLQEYQIHIPDLNEVDRCKSCHLGIDREDSILEEQPFKKHPGNYIFLKNHPLKDFGCAVCHEGQGRATNSVEKAHGEVEYWLKPMLRGSLAQSSCIKCHESTENLPGASLISKGKETFVSRGCIGCHDVEGIDNVKIGPPLTHIGSKVSYKWFETWLKNPRDYYEKARMPNFMFSDEEIKNITDFFLDLSKDESDLTVAANLEVDEDMYQKGRAIYNQSRCVVCHPIEDMGGAIKYVYAPDHSKIASKVSKEWLTDWMKDPKAYHPETTMPRYRFSDEEIEALVAYMSGEFIDWDALEEEEEEGEEASVVKREIDPESVEKGRILVRDYGCFGCHEIKGFENESKIGVELTSFGAKDVHFLDFGVVKNIEKSWLSWTTAKLENPRQFREGISRMPKFSLEDEELDALLCLLTSFKERTIPVKYFVKSSAAYEYEPQGEFGKLVKDLNCLVCHRINDVGGSFAPDLTFEGSRVTEEWLKDFLAAPDILRPLSKQMPKFNLTEEEVEVITDYIKLALVDDEVVAGEELGEITSNDVAQGKKIYNEKGCQSCHQIGLEGGALGPNLSVVGDRLTPDYIYMHLKDPQKWGSSNVAPNYNLDDDELKYLTRYLSDLRAKKLGFLWKHTNIN